MDRILVDSFDVNLKSAVRDFQSRNFIGPFALLSVRFHFQRCEISRLARSHGR